MPSTTLLLNIPSSHLRVALRIYFSILLFLVAFIGSRCCALRVKLKLLQGRSIKVTEMTGWLTMSEAFKTIGLTRSYSLGWMGLAMILTGALATIADLVVSGLVVTENVSSRCTFNTSGLYSVIAADYFDNAYVGPANTGAFYNLITQAQQISVRNGGIDAIYDKVNGNPEFLATNEDSLGTWHCEDVNNEQTFPSDTDPNLLVSDLQSQDLLYSNSSSACWQIYPDSSTNHITAWSGNQPARPGGSWDILASFDTSKTSYSLKVMQTYHCTMNAPSAEWVLRQTLLQSTLELWCNTLKGNMYTDTGSKANFTSDPESILQSTLNTLVMNAGLANNLTTSLISDPTQGCLAPRSSVPWPVVLLFLVVTMAVLAMAVYYLILLLGTIHVKRRRENGVMNAAENLSPIGLLSWMKLTIKESSGAAEVKMRALPEWYYGSPTFEEPLRLFKRYDNGNLHEDMTSNFIHSKP